jgi:uncharacterized protein YehS (DUF1456 family)
MDNNDILIRLRYALDIKDADMVEVFRLGGLEVTKETVQQMLSKIQRRMTQLTLRAQLHRQAMINWLAIMRH